MNTNNTKNNYIAVPEKADPRIMDSLSSIFEVPYLRDPIFVETKLFGTVMRENIGGFRYEPLYQLLGYSNRVAEYDCAWVLNDKHNTENVSCNEPDILIVRILNMNDDLDRRFSFMHKKFVQNSSLTWLESSLLFTKLQSTCLLKGTDDLPPIILQHHTSYA